MDSRRDRPNPNNARPGNDSALKHNAYGLAKRVEVGLTTKEDYSRFVAILDKWGYTPADVQSMGMLGSAIENRAWLHLIASDATGAYLFVKENFSDDLELITRLGRNATYQLSKADSGLLELSQILQKDDSGVIDAIASARGDE